jgi:3D (Asp-Asp-Asp) domain-containing protein
MSARHGRTMPSVVACAFASALVATALGGSAAHARGIRTFSATAYSIHGRTASGSRARPGVVAADPAVLPLGSRIRIMDAGRLSGEYVVEDTGGAIRGRAIDIYVADEDAARRFGRRPVRVEVLGRGR